MRGADILGDIDAAEDILSSECDSTDALASVLALGRVAALAKRGKCSAQLGPYLDTFNPAQRTLWRTACSAFDSELDQCATRMQDTVKETISELNASEEFSAALERVIPMLYDKLLGGIVQHTGSLFSDNVDVAQLQRHIEQLNLQLAAAEEGSETIQVTVHSKEATDTRDAAVLQVKALQRENEALQQRVGKYEKENSGLRRTLQALTDEVATRDAQITKAQTHCEHLQQQLFEQHQQLCLLQLAQDAAARDPLYGKESAGEPAACVSPSEYGTPLARAEPMQTTLTRADDSDLPACRTPNTQFLVKGRYANLEVSTGRSGIASKRAASPAALGHTGQGSPLKRPAHTCQAGSADALQSPGTVVSPLSPSRAMAPDTATDSADLALHSQHRSRQPDRPADPSASIHCAAACGPDDVHSAGCSVGCGTADDFLWVGHASIADRVDASAQCDSPARKDTATQMAGKELLGGDSGSHADAHQPAANSVMVKQAIEAGIASITSTNKLLRNLQVHFMPRLQLMAGRVGAAHHIVQSIKDQAAHQAPDANAARNDAGQVSAEAEAGRVCENDEASALKQSSSCSGEGQLRCSHDLHQAFGSLECHVIGMPGPDEDTKQSVARQLFEKHTEGDLGLAPSTYSSGHMGSRSVPGGAGLQSLQTSLRVQPPSLGMLVGEARRQKLAAFTVLAMSPPSADSGLDTPRWAAGLGSEASTGASPRCLISSMWDAHTRSSEQPGNQTALSRDIHGKKASPHCPTFGVDVLPCANLMDADILSLHQSLAKASCEQHELLEELQLELQGLTDRVAASALELDMLRAEADRAREQTVVEKQKLAAVEEEYSKAGARLKIAKAALARHAAERAAAQSRHPHSAEAGPVQAKVVKVEDMSIRDAARHASLVSPSASQVPWDSAAGATPGPQLTVSPGTVRPDERGQVIHVHVDVEGMRKFLAEWKDRGCKGEPPSGIRVMSQWEHLIDDASEQLSRLDEAVEVKRRLLLDLEHRIIDVQSQLGSLHQERERAHNDALETAMQLAGCKRDLSSACEDVRQLEVRLSELRHECSSLDAAKVASQVTIRELDDAAGAAEERKCSVTHEAERAERALRDTTAQQEELALELDAKRGELATMQAQLLQANTELAALDDDKEKALAAHHTAQAAVVEARARVQSLDAACSDLQLQQTHLLQAACEFVKSAEPSCKEQESQAGVSSGDVGTQAYRPLHAHAVVQTSDLDADDAHWQRPQKCDVSDWLPTPGVANNTAIHLHTALREARAALAEQKARLNELEEQCNERQCELKEAKKAVQQCKEGADEARRAHAHAAAAAAGEMDRVAALRLEAASIRAQLSALQVDLADSVEARDMAQDELKEARIQHAALQEKVKATASDQATVEARRNVVTQHLAEVRVELARAERQRDELLGSLEAGREEARKLKADSDDLKEEHAGLQRALATGQLRCKELSCQEAALVTAVVEMEGTRKAHQLQAAAAEERLQGLQADVLALETCHAESQKQLDGLLQQRAAACAEVTAAYADLDHVASKHSRLGAARACLACAAAQSADACRASRCDAGVQTSAPSGTAAGGSQRRIACDKDADDADGILAGFQMLLASANGPDAHDGGREASAWPSPRGPGTQVEHDTACAAATAQAASLEQRVLDLQAERSRLHKEVVALRSSHLLQSLELAEAEVAAQERDTMRARAQELERLASSHEAALVSTAAELEQQRACTASVQRQLEHWQSTARRLHSCVSQAAGLTSSAGASAAGPEGALGEAVAGALARLQDAESERDELSAGHARLLQSLEANVREAASLRSQLRDVVCDAERGKKEGARLAAMQVEKQRAQLTVTALEAQVDVLEAELTRLQCRGGGESAWQATPAPELVISQLQSELSACQADLADAHTQLAGKESALEAMWSLCGEAEAEGAAALAGFVSRRSSSGLSASHTSVTQPPGQPADAPSPAATGCKASQEPPPVVEGATSSEAALLHSCAELQRRCSQLSAQLHRVVTERDAASAEARALQGRLSECSESYARAQAALAVRSATASLSHESATHEQHTAQEVAELRSKLACAAAKLQAQEQVCQAYAEHLDNVRARVLLVHQQSHDSADAQGLERHLQDLTVQIEAARAELAGLEGKKALLNGQIEQLQREVSSVKSRGHHTTAPTCHALGAPPASEPAELPPQGAGAGTDGPDGGGVAGQRVPVDLAGGLLTRVEALTADNARLRREVLGALSAAEDAKAAAALPAGQRRAASSRLGDGWCQEHLRAPQHDPQRAVASVAARRAQADDLPRAIASSETCTAAEHEQRTVSCKDAASQTCHFVGRSVRDASVQAARHSSEGPPDRVAEAAASAAIAIAADKGVLGAIMALISEGHFVCASKRLTVAFRRALAAATQAMAPCQEGPRSAAVPSPLFPLGLHPDEATVASNAKVSGQRLVVKHSAEEALAALTHCLATMSSDTGALQRVMSGIRVALAAAANFDQAVSPPQSGNRDSTSVLPSDPAGVHAELAAAAEQALIKYLCSKEEGRHVKRASQTESVVASKANCAHSICEAPVTEVEGVAATCSGPIPPAQPHQADAACRELEGRPFRPCAASSGGSRKSAGQRLQRADPARDAVHEARVLALQKVQAALAKLQRAAKT